MKTEHVYIHFPFCVSKCPYCDFFSIPFNDPEIHKKYIGYLLKEAANYNEITGHLKSLYIGGGTPSLMNSDILEKILNSFIFYPECEITIEVNPATADFNKLRSFKDLGVNRISIGTQSFISSELKTLGRSHDANDIYDCYDNARKAGFENISIDLIIGIPGQTPASVQFNATEAVNIAPEHISTYILTFYDHTPFYKKLERAEIFKHDDDTEMDFFDLTSEILEKYCYKKYEISNFSKPGKESVHNSNTWNFGSYLGLGAAAHSFFGKTRWENPRSIENWYYSVVNSRKGYKETQSDTVSLKNEFIMLGLRRTDGLNTGYYRAFFGSDIMEDYKVSLNKYLNNKILVKNGDCIRFDQKKIGIFNSVVSDIIL
jgi:oxygen-independent coproporphyrinogen III oxidase